jgi:hypothetical protein
MRGDQVQEKRRRPDIRQRIASIMPLDGVPCALYVLKHHHSGIVDHLADRL